MKLTNNWIGYVERSAEQIFNRIKSLMPANTPEITDLTDGNPFIKAARVWAALTEHLNYYIDAKARESFLATCRKFSSAVQHARAVDYRVRGPQAASADLLFYLDTAAAAPVEIPAGTVAATPEGIEYVTLAAVTIPTGALSVSAPAKQWAEQTAALGLTTGLAGQRFALEPGAVDQSAELTVGDQVYEPAETFAFENSASQSFVAGLNTAGLMEAELGDGTNGHLPGPGVAVSANYYVTAGAAGNTAENTITRMVTLINTGGPTLKVRNPNRAAGGTDAETLADLKKKVPLFTRTQDRAVTLDDYIATALLAPGVAQAGITNACGKKVLVFVAPTGGGIAGSTLLDSVVAYFELRRMVTTKIEAKAAGEVKIKLKINIRVRPSHYRAVTQTEALNNILKFLSAEYQAINGTVEQGNIYEILENTPGVEVSEVKLMAAIPYARPVKGTAVLDWAPEILAAASVSARWRLTIAGSDRFQLIRENSFIGEYDQGTPVILNELQLTVNPGAYVPGDAWEFFTYPYNRSIELREPSLPVAYADTVEINAVGGLS